VGDTVWTVRLSASAAADFRQFLGWTAENLGTAQTGTYADTLSAALQALSAGPATTGVKARPEIAADIRTLHVTRQGRKGRHFVLFRAISVDGQNFIDVLRLLHDSMDLKRHSPADEAGPAKMRP
jgi:toxin ParE1/3/4